MELLLQVYVFVGVATIIYNVVTQIVSVERDIVQTGGDDDVTSAFYLFMFAAFQIGVGALWPIYWTLIAIDVLSKDRSE